MVTSSTTIGVSAIPTGIFILPRKNIDFRSPDLYYDYYSAYYVGLGGDVLNNYGSVDEDSYGRSSPVLEVSIGVWCVDNFGANDSDDVWDVDYSYGRLTLRSFLNTTIVHAI